MKPLMLTICGWGPYKEKAVIDFTRFDGKGIFLITGATGAGKTTIFDAITYALYGCMSGEMREKNSVRSDFAEVETKTYVNLKMEHGKKQYTITRNPEYIRPKKRKGSGNSYTKEKENAVLTLPEGNVIEGIGEVNKKIQEILSLDERQFKQITMIAQGEFAKLLSASGAEKTKIFREIFGTGIYERFGQQLKERAKTLYAKVQKLHHEMQEDISLFQEESREWEELTKSEYYNYNEICGYLKKSYESCEKAVRQLEKKATADDQERLRLNGIIGEIKRDEELFDKLEETRGRKEELLLKGNYVAEREAALKRAEAADKVFFYEKAFFEAEDRKNKALEDCKQKAERRDMLLEEQRELQPFYESRIEREHSLMLLIKAEELEQHRGILEKAIDGKEKELEICQKDYERAESTFLFNKHHYEEADSLYRCAIVGVVARMVKVGEPCPVCGSIEHPIIAALSDEVPDEEILKALQETYEESSLNRQEKYQRAVHVKAEAIQIKEQLFHCIEEQKACINVNEYDFRKPYEAEKKILQDKISRYESLFVLLLEMQEQESAAKISLSEEMKKAKKREEEFRSALKKQEFKQEDYQACLMEEEKREKEKEAIAAYYETLRGTEELLLHLQESLQGKKREDLLPFYHKQEELNQLREENLKQLKSLSLKKENAKRAFVSIHDKLGKIKPLEEAYGLVKDLDNLASGNNQKKLVFEQYVLTGYFEEILRAANLRLSKMTNGRYELLRAESISDGRAKDNMEMLVMDYYTGKSRSVKTLSGGESFKASLALALGMSDVIQAASGGIRVEALFVDEGFGALDSESLDLACETLLKLAGTNKIIGIISHVQELRERIGCQIVVEKTNHGSCLKCID